MKKHTWKVTIYYRDDTKEVYFCENCDICENYCEIQIEDEKDRTTLVTIPIELVKKVEEIEE